MRLRLPRPAGPGLAPSVALLLVAAALLAAALVAIEVHPATSAPLPRGGGTVSVVRASAVCPDPAVDATTVSTLDVAAPGGPGTPATPGRVTVRPASGRGSALGSIAAASTTSVRATAGDVPLLATATGALAPGLAATLTTRSTGTELRGLSSTTCAAPGTDFWFVGSGAVIGQRGRVYLTNSEPVPAVVDVTLYGPDGVVDAPTGRGVTVAAGGQQVLKLDALAPDAVHLGIHVVARQGRVSAAVRDQQVQGLTPRGADWLPPSVPPARRLVLPGVLPGAGERRLMLVVPGDTDAIVRVRIVGSDGGFVPSGLDVVEARAGRLTDLDLSTYAGGRPVAVELRADRPLVAGVLSEVDVADEKPSEIAYTAGAPTLTRATPGVVPDLRGQAAGDAVRSQLLLAAPDGPAVVELSPLPPATGAARRVSVPADRQVALDATTLSAASTYGVLLRPAAGSGPVMVARQTGEVTGSGTFVTTTLVVPPRFQVTVPPVFADLSTGLRPRQSSGPSSSP